MMPSNTSRNVFQTSPGRRDLEVALGESRAVTERAYSSAFAAVQELHKLLAGLRDRVEKAAAKTPGTFNFLRGSSQGILEDVQKRIEEELERHVRGLEQALRSKKARLGDFTVVLLGRTMAGKSTLREALTRGDGSTIGKGAQRTTRDIREYRWQGLVVLDTPGIGAFAGQEDSRLALSTLDQADLVLFLVSSDGIQESSFEAMKRLYRQNKPVIFVLNVKRDLTKAVYLRRFLRNPDGYLGPSAIGGHVKRLRFLARHRLGMRQTRVVAIHAQAAFLASQEEDPAESRRLLEASGLPRLLDALCEEVVAAGPARRLQTLLEGTAIQFSRVAEELRALGSHLTSEHRRLHRVFSRLDSQLHQSIHDWNERFAQDAKLLVGTLRRQVPTFVEEHIEDEAIAKEWEARLRRLDIDAWSKQEAQAAYEDISQQLSDFLGRFRSDQELRIRLSGPEGLPGGRILDTKRLFGWLSAILLLATLRWPPFGLVSLAPWLASLFCKSKEDKLAVRRRTLQSRLYRHLDRLERKLTATLRKWFYESVTRQVVDALRRDVRTFVKVLEKQGKRLHSAAKAVEDQSAELHRRLVIELMALQGVSRPGSKVRKVVRVPGQATKILWHGGIVPEGFEAALGHLLGERVDIVLRGPREQVVAQALRPAEVSPMDVLIEKGTAVVFLDAAERPKAIGRQGVNVRLAECLTDLRIELEAGAEMRANKRKRRKARRC